MTPKIGDANTINDTAKDNMPTAIRNILDHFEIFLSTIPCMILAIPTKSSPTASKLTKKIVASRGNAITAIPNPIAKTPNTILPIRDDFVRCGKTPTATLSIPTTSNVTDSRKIKVAIPSPGLTSIAIDSIIAIAPSTICEILIPLEKLVSLAVKYNNL